MVILGCAFSFVIPSDAGAAEDVAPVAAADRDGGATLPTGVAPALAENRALGTIFRRDIFLRRYRFRRVREWAAGPAEVVMSVSARESGADVEGTQITKLPRLDLFENVRRSKREKKCNNGNDQTCSMTLADNPDCRWTIHNGGGDLVYTENKLGVGGTPDFCAPVELFMEWHEMDRDPGTFMTTIVDNILSPIGCLGPIFNNPGADPVERVFQTLACGLQTYLTLQQVHDQIFNIPYTEEQFLGYLQTGTGVTTHVPAPTAVGTSCLWSPSGYPNDAGDISDTWKGKTAQAEFTQTVVALGPAASVGTSACACSLLSGSPDSAHVQYLQIAQESSCELRGEVRLTRTQLKDPDMLRRFVRVYFDTDGSNATGDPAPPNCGADYLVEFQFDGVPGGSPPGVDVTRSVSAYAGGAWGSPVPEAVFDVDVRPCEVSFSVSLRDLGNPPPFTVLEAWCVTLDALEDIVDVMPINGGCIDPLELPLTSELVCPTVVGVDKIALEYGNKAAPIRVEFSEVMNPINAGQVTIDPAVPFTVSMSANAKFLFINPDPEFGAYAYLVTLDGSISDCAGNGLASEPGTTCGDGVTFPVCVPDVNLTVSDSMGNPRRSFERSENIYLSGSGLEAFPNPTITAYVTPASILSSKALLPILIDETGGPLTHGPDTFAPTTPTSIALRNLGPSNLEGEYVIILDVNNDGLYERWVDRTTSPCLLSFIVGCPEGALRSGGDCQPCSDAIGARIAYWPLNEDYTGAGIKDYENDNDGVSSGLPTFATGKRGNAVFFDMTNTGHFVVAAGPDLAIGADEEFALSGWVNPDVTSGAHTILDHRGAGLGYRLSIVADKLTLELADGSGVGTYASAAPVPAATWTHFFVAVDRSAANGLRMYLDGALDSTHDASGHNGTLAGGSDLWIGGDQVTSGATFLGGLDELAVWDEPLLAGEVLSLYQADDQDLPCPLDPSTGIADSWPAVTSPPSGLRMLRKPVTPFRDALYITLDMPRDGAARLDLYDASGRRISTVTNGVLSPGRHDFTWTTRSEGAGAVSSGVYFLRLEALGRSETEKVVLVR